MFHPFFLRHPAKPLEIVAMLVLLVAACAPDSGTSSPQPGESTGAGGSHRATPSGIPATPSAGEALPFRTFFPDRQALVGRAVTVRGRVLFVLRCPPPTGGTRAPCTALAYLTDAAARELPASGVDERAVQLFRGGRGIGCAAHTTRGLRCGGLRHDIVHVVTATATEAHGRVVLDVVTSEPAD